MRSTTSTIRFANFSAALSAVIALPVLFVRMAISLPVFLVNALE
jgi:hypothetical protein